MAITWVRPSHETAQSGKHNQGSWQEYREGAQIREIRGNIVGVVQFDLCVTSASSASRRLIVGKRKFTVEAQST